jgi:hypothetical protein
MGVGKLRQENISTRYLKGVVGNKTLEGRSVVRIVVPTILNDNRQLFMFHERNIGPLFFLYDILKKSKIA